MVDFWYNRLIPAFEHASLVANMSDTDSFAFTVTYPISSTRNFWTDIMAVVPCLDISTVNETHPLITNNPDKKQYLLDHIKNSKGVLGLLKNEIDPQLGNQSDPTRISEIICLRPKLYSYKLSHTGEEAKKCKGISRYVTKNHISFENYREVLTTTHPLRHSMRVIRSEDHQLYINSVNKCSLSLFCNKRYWINKYSSLPFGHPACSSLEDHDYYSSLPSAHPACSHLQDHDYV